MGRWLIPMGLSLTLNPTFGGPYVSVRLGRICHHFPLLLTLRRPPHLVEFNRNWKPLASLVMFFCFLMDMWHFAGDLRQARTRIYGTLPIFIRVILGKYTFIPCLLSPFLISSICDISTNWASKRQCSFMNSKENTTSLRSTSQNA